ncbi:MAG: YggS family pyridoxal phosphate-dependent enzyme [Bacteroidetes bacterium]|nr:YggS family pyridoxal phosphate-dependent enzyme [Bacteroidota bacterium]
MAIAVERFLEIKKELDAAGVLLVAVSKKKPIEDILALYKLGQRDFGENYVQELLEKQPLLPADIRWHFIGHLQRNKVKYIAGLCSLIQGVDSLALLDEINKQASKQHCVIDCLLQVHIAQEETKFGFDEAELAAVLSQIAERKNVRVLGLMGMASFTTQETSIRAEFRQLKSMANKFAHYFPINQTPIVSMGMSGDYSIALEEGSTLVRIGSLLFGAR